ncbi:MAG TPA: hypothetical protein PKC20_09015, partial [Burkholderiaceae bacterium]|nr:hypothetical protein [Burkholderiaceae bacterium]
EKHGMQQLRKFTGWYLKGFPGTKKKLPALHLVKTLDEMKALIADLVPPQRLGTAFGWFHLVAGLGLVPASAGFGWAWERFGAAAAFGASGAIAAVAAAAAVGVLGTARPR